MKLRKFPKMPKKSASLDAIKRKEAKFKEVAAHNKKILADRAAKQRAYDGLTKLKASVR